jgi:hypothetical protein
MGKKDKALISALLFFASLALFIIFSTGCTELCSVSAFRLDSISEIAEGLVVSSAVAFLLIVSPSVPSWLSKPVAAHLRKGLVLTLALSGVFVYILFAVAYETYYSFASSYENGIAAAVVWALTVLCVSFRVGIVKAFTIFGFPAVVLLMFAVLSTNYLNMTSSISNLIQWDLNLRGWNYIPLVSNWFVLTVAGFLCIRQITAHLQIIPMTPCVCGNCFLGCRCGDCSRCA